MRKFGKVLLAIMLLPLVYLPAAGLLTLLLLLNARMRLDEAFLVLTGGPLVALFTVMGTLAFFYGLYALFVRKSPDRAPTQLTEDEVRLMQELHRGLSRLEERVEALETLLLEGESGPEEDFRRRLRSDPTPVERSNWKDHPDSGS